jgi:hypothetical protein
MSPGGHPVFIHRLLETNGVDADPIEELHRTLRDSICSSLQSAFRLCAALID